MTTKPPKPPANPLDPWVAAAALGTLWWINTCQLTIAAQRALLFPLERPRPKDKD